MNANWSRRRFVRASAAALGAVAAGGNSAYAEEERRERAKNPRFLIVLSATGGANLVDSFMSVRESECSRARTMNAYPDSLVQSIGEFRAVDFKSKKIGAIPAAFTANQSNFVRKHQQDMMVVTQTGTSVNHFVAQQRSINGNAAWLGRTLQEAVALTYGAGYPIPNVHLLTVPGSLTGEPIPAYPVMCMVSGHRHRTSGRFRSMATRVFREPRRGSTSSRHVAFATSNSIPIRASTRRLARTPGSGVGA